MQPDHSGRPSTLAGRPGKRVIDLNYTEDSQAEVDLNVVMTEDGRFIEVQGTAENKPFSPETLEEMLRLAQGALQEITSLQKRAISEAAL